MKYTKYVPSAIYVSVPDIPLYDHLKTTAAIALCKYRSSMDEKYLLIMGDLSGIQNFIFYNLKGGEAQRVDEKATKRMRGRSFLINLMIDSAVKYIVEKLDLYEFNVLWQSGGNFLILAPNEENVEDKLEEIRKNINEFLLKEFGRVYLNLAWLPRRSLENFDETLELLHEKMDEVKSKRYVDFVRDESFYIGESKGKYLCPVCGVHFVDSPDDICESCERITQLGDKIGKGKYLIRSLNSGGDFAFQYSDLTISYSVVDALQDVDLAEVFSLENFEMPPVGAIRGFKVLKTHVPKAGTRVLSISELVAMDESLL